jgi:hypothetical protein
MAPACSPSVNIFSHFSPRTHPSSAHAPFTLCDVQVGNPASTAADAVLYSAWAAKVAPVLHAAGMRLTADVADWGAMISV